MLVLLLIRCQNGDRSSGLGQAYNDFATNAAVADRDDSDAPAQVSQTDLLLALLFLRVLNAMSFSACVCPFFVDAAFSVCPMKALKQVVTNKPMNSTGPKLQRSRGCSGGSMARRVQVPCRRLLRERGDSFLSLPSSRFGSAGSAPLERDRQLYQSRREFRRACETAGKSGSKSSGVSSQASTPRAWASKASFANGKTCCGSEIDHGFLSRVLIPRPKTTKCDDLIHALLEEHGISQEAVLGENGLIAQLKKRVVERALAGELTRARPPEEIDNHRNGYSKKTVVGEDGAMEIEVPRDRNGKL